LSELGGIFGKISTTLAGLANGLFGAGGGMFLVPLFCRWVKLPSKVSLATSFI
jgi:uncharacterized membrane protein YfcA